MLFSKAEFATFISLPLVTILLVWSTAIFHKNRKKWRPYDIGVVSVIVSSIIRNLTALSYVIVTSLSQFNTDYCSIIIWIFNSIHTFQASCLSTLAVIGLFSIKLKRKNQNLRQFLTATHVIYHLFCLLTLCACVGVAAILANDSDNGHICNFMPYELDIKFNVFIIVLHCFLSSVSLISIILTVINYFKLKNNKNNDIYKSTSDLSDLSLENTLDSNKNYYDTYIIRSHYEKNNCNSDFSTTVSSTNSRRPLQENNKEMEGSGLETVQPVLIVCYLFYHLPLIVFCIYPNLIQPWPVSGMALWLGLVQDLLIPTGLSIIDPRFCDWISSVYKCSNKTDADKLPHVGLVGKFRPFSSPPQNIEPPAQKCVRGYQNVEQRFPLTNGSLYTSIDGRLPIIHNYRRHNKDCRELQKNYDPNYPAPSHLRRPSSSYQNGLDKFCCRNCETDLCPSHSNLHHLSPHYITQKINMLQKALTQPSHNLIRTSLSQESILQRNEKVVFHNEINNRICKSDANINNNHHISTNSNNNNDNTDYSSDDDYVTDNNLNLNDNSSLRSSISITTDANCDFEFYNNNNQKSDYKPPPATTITRSNSKSSFDNFQHFVERENVSKLNRSSSFMTLEDRKRVKKLLRTDSKLSDCTHNYKQKIKSVEYLPNSNASTVFIEDVAYFHCPKRRCRQGDFRGYVGSVPDLKKVFISEYI